LLLAVAALVVPIAHARPGGLPACESAPCPSDPRAPIVILSYFDGSGFARLVRAVKHSGMPAGIPIYYGNYWGAGKPSRPAPRHKRPKPVMPNRRYAPILPLKWSVFWRKRSLGPSFRRELARSHDVRLAGRLPRLPSLLHRSGQYRYQAGLELGRRFRDRIRAKRLGGLRIVSWQFDEVPNEALHSGAVRTFLRGIFRGVAYGRPALGDNKLPGIIYVAEPALRIRDSSFWRAVDDSSMYVVGEEYPDFVGSPAGAAQRAHSLQHGLPQDIRSKYIVGATPGYRAVRGLGGNVRHRGYGAVSSWQTGYLRSRARQGVDGFGVFNFFERNGAAAIMNRVLRAVARGLVSRGS
jgi:hypothetical protein